MRGRMPKGFKFDRFEVSQRDFAGLERALDSGFKPNRKLKAALAEARRKVRCT